MALLECGGRKFTIPVGEVVLGSDPGCAISLTGAGLLARHAVLQGLPDGQVVIRKAAREADVLINGVRLGAEPTPLLHGDKVEAGGHELTFVDERRSGSTQYIQAMSMPQAMAQARAGKGAAGAATANTGGRVVCLTDGREYLIAGASLVFGREAGCDVVVPGKDVSRRHAEIVASPKGYLLVDSSTNGTFVNEERVQGQRILARADIIRIGDEQFRFYADAAPAAPSPQPGPAASTPQAAPPSPLAAPGAPSPPPLPVGASERLKHTVHGAGPGAPPPSPVPGPQVPAAPARPSQAGPLASFLVKSGARKGQRVPIKTPVVNIGRADYNDVVLPDESVSTSHAKLQRREGVWVLVDLESTNGTFVDGERVQDETPLAPGAAVRCGDVHLVFEPTDDALGVAKGGGTRLLEVVKPPPAPAPAAAPPPAPAKPVAPPAAKPKPKRPATPPPPEKKGCGSSAAVIVLGLVALVSWILV